MATGKAPKKEAQPILFGSGLSPYETNWQRRIDGLAV